MKTEKPLMYPRADVSPPLRLLACLLAFVALALPVSAQAKGREDARVIVATQVMEELRAQRDQYIPDRLLERAYGIAVVPDVKKGAVGFGLRGGKGVLVVRDRQGRLSNPVFITLAGGSFGWQLGVQSTDLVLVFTTRAGIDGITDGKLTLGGDASVAAGPVGRSISASASSGSRRLSKRNISCTVNGASSRGFLRASAARRRRQSFGSAAGSSRAPIKLPKKTTVVALCSAE